MDDEIWKPLSEDPKYVISNYGRLKNTINGKEISQRDDRYGYPKVSLYTRGIKNTRNIHRLVAKEFVEGFDPNLQVNHINGNKHDNRSVNLEWVSAAENISHAYNTHLNYGPPRKQVRVIETGDIYESEKDCAKAINGSISGVNGCLKGRRNTHKGYSFCYVEKGADI